MADKKMDKSRKGKILLPVLALLLTSAVTAFLSLTLAFWTGQHAIFYSYFDRPVVLLLNYLPILALQLFLVACIGKQWIAFFLSSSLIFAGAAGNFFKMTYRKCPFVASDFSYILTALGVSSNYNIAFNSRMWLFVLYILLSSLLLFILRKKVDLSGGRARILLLLIVVLAASVLWNWVYSSEEIYNSDRVCCDDGCIGINGEIRQYITKGFTYPFVYSIKEYLDVVPEGYSRENTEKLLSSYNDSVIEDNKKVNIIVFQIESFADLTRAGVKGIASDTYTVYNEIKDRAYHGDLIESVYGGGTIETEHSVLTGNHTYFLAEKEIPSFVRYFAENGYRTVGGHPMESYYNRDTINRFLGFEGYRFAENKIYDGTDLNECTPTWWYSDRIFFPSVLKQYRELAADGKNVFSFNVTMQGHGLYESGRKDFEDLYFGDDYSEATSNSLNNYLGSMKDTQQYMLEFLEELEADEIPCVILFYGDHKGDFTNGNQDELIGMDPDTLEGHYKMYSTEYLMWANKAAKNVIGDDFVGEGPTISANYLFPLLFSKLGWGGNAYSKYLLEMSEELPVITSNGFYVEKGEPCFSLSEDGAEKLNQYKCIEYYLNYDLKPELIN